MKFHVELRKILLSFIGLIGMLMASGQEYSPEVRARFVEDQNAYYQELNLSDNQKRRYEEITRRYDKQFLAIDRSNRNSRQKKKLRKTVRKAKDVEMRAVLADDQYKLYLKRQKEIAENYNE